ncbi:MAG TPA: TetR/AcrR family transcriptional regulator [Blastocatellia bacterium]|nr:TetR/AcrR family transcriptional regulator [Blastocatellia bacterium]
MSDSVTGATTDPKQARSKQTKEKIVLAAIELFQARGYEKTTSNDIAAAAGVSVGSFYVYFVDKRQLLLTIFDRLADDVFKVIFDGLNPEHLFDEQLRPMIRDAVSRAIEDKCRHSGLIRVISEMVLKDPDFRAKQKEMMGRSVARIRELISLSRKAGITWEIDVDAAAFVVQRVVNDISQDVATGIFDFDKEKGIDAVTDMIYRFLFKASIPEHH